MKKLKTTENISLSPEWYKGEYCNWTPDTIQLGDPDWISKYILDGWLPEKPFITKKQGITAFGSCFAQHISNYLQQLGCNLLSAWTSPKSPNVPIVLHLSALVSTFAIRQQFEWAWNNRQFTQNTWFNSPDAPFLQDEVLRNKTKELLDKTEVFILTFGVSEVWYDKVTNDVFWKAIPLRSFDPERHGFRVSTCSENTENIQKIVSLIKEHKPEASIILTLSPVPLLTTFRPVTCITANSVSKALLRVAIDEVMRSNEYSSLFYWPSYEIVTEAFSDVFKKDRRHIKPYIISKIMELFHKYYIKD